jgi:hypothetical protein
MDAFVAAVGQVHTIDPADCRRHVEVNFGVDRMAAGYEKVYLAAVAAARRPREVASRAHAWDAVHAGPDRVRRDPALAAHSAHSGSGHLAAAGVGVDAARGHVLAASPSAGPPPARSAP